MDEGFNRGTIRLNAADIRRLLLDCRADEPPLCQTTEVASGAAEKLIIVYGGSDPASAQTAAAPDDKLRSR